MANHFVRRILVDGGCLVSILLLDALKRMNIIESDNNQKVLGPHRIQRGNEHPIGEIMLPIYIEGINSIQTFCVINTLSSYNVRPGRPWIHEMKFVNVSSVC